MISIRKRGKVYQYCFEAGKVNGKRNNVDIKIIRFNNNVDKLQEKIDEIINNSDKFKRILPNKI